MRVLENWVPKSRIATRSLASWPAIVSARHSIVDLFPRALADIIDEHAASPRLDGEGVRIAQSERPNRTVHSTSRVEEWIVGRNRSVPIDAQHFSQSRRQTLGIGRNSVFSHRHVKLSVFSEMD